MQNNVLRAVINARLPARDGWWQITLEHGLIAAITPQPALRAAQPDELDAQQGLVVPPFVEPHIHLDTTQTAGQPAWNQSGTLFEGIERWAERKAQLTHDDVKQRAWQTLKWQIANGIQYVRSHVDVSDPSLTALKAMLEVRQEVAPWVDLQLVAFPQEGISPIQTARICWRRRCDWAQMWWGPFLILSLPVNMVWSRFIKSSHWPRAMAA